MKNKVSYIIIAIVGIALYALLFIYGENKLSILIGFLMTILAIVLGTILKKKYNFYEKMDNKTQKFFKWYVIIGCTITVVCLLLLALYIHNKTA